MATAEMMRTSIDYHIAITRRVWDSIDRVSDEQFLAEDSYSRGSIRNLMVHLPSTDRRWLTGLKNLADVGHVKFGDYPSRAEARALFELAAQDLTDYAGRPDNAQVTQNAAGMPSPRWVILMHMISHGTDHRSTVLQKLNQLGAPTFDQDCISWPWSRA